MHWEIVMAEKLAKTKTSKKIWKTPEVLIEEIAISTEGGGFVVPGIENPVYRPS